MISAAGRQRRNTLTQEITSRPSLGLPDDLRRDLGEAALILSQLAGICSEIAFKLAFPIPTETPAPKPRPRARSKRKDADVR
jgi:hypothetical protein